MNAFKTLPAALVAALTVLVAQGTDVLPAWALLILAAAVAGFAVYATPPGPGLRTPERAEPRRRRVPGEGGYLSQGANLVILVVGILAAILLFVEILGRT